MKRFLFPSPASAPERFPASSRAARVTRHLALAGMVIGLSMGSAVAAENPREDDEDEGSRWGLGLGVGVMEKPYRDIGSETIFRPIIIYDNEWVSLRGGTIGFKLPSVGPVAFQLEVDFSNDGYDASDSPFLAGMEDREDEFWAGASMVWENRIADLSVSWATDVSGNSEGQKFRLSADRTFERGKFAFTPSLTALWLDEDYVNYFYGVRADEVRPDRAFYEPEATVNLEAGFRTTYQMTRRDSVFVDVSVGMLGSEIEDSPIVDGSTDSRVFIGYVRMF